MKITNTILLLFCTLITFNVFSIPQTATQNFVENYCRVTPDNIPRPLTLWQAWWDCVGDDRYTSCVNTGTHILSSIVDNRGKSKVVRCAPYIDGCSEGQELNMETGYCENSTPVCKSGAYFNNSTKLCETTLETKKNQGPQNICNGTNPINGSTGNKYQLETDYQGSGLYPLVFQRHYNSTDTRIGSIGKSWRHSYSASLTIAESQLSVNRPSGQSFQFQKPSDQWLADADINFHINQQNNGQWRLVRDDDVVEFYDDQGRLISIQMLDKLTQTLTYDITGRLQQVTDPVGRSLLFNYASEQADAKLVTLTLPDQQTISYRYSSKGNLSEVIYPDTTLFDATGNPTKHYHYENNAYLSALTGMTDENGKRFATWRYGSRGRAVLSEHANGANRTRLRYKPEEDKTEIMDAYNSTRIYHFDSINGVYKDTGYSQPGGSGCNAASSRVIYNENGSISSRIDFNGHRTDYRYDLTRNLQTSRRVGLSETGATTEVTKTIDTQWHDKLRRPIKITQSDLETEWNYNEFGHLVEKKQTDRITGRRRSTTLSYTYADNDSGVVLQKVVDGARTDTNDLTIYDYYPLDITCKGDHFGCRSQLRKTTNALGHETQFTRYNAHGQLEETIDPNGLITRLHYDARQRLIAVDRGDQHTDFYYDAIGQLIQITRPDNSHLYYHYDAAHRLTGMTDNQGNTIHYTLDAMGNHLSQTIKDPTGQLSYKLEQQYDALGRLLLRIGGENQIQRYQYDANGNLSAQTDPRQTSRDPSIAKLQDPYAKDNTSTARYDALNRLISQVHRQKSADQDDDISSHYQYNHLDQLIKITDPNGFETHYHYDALGNLLQQQSPDTGITDYTYDAAGNRSSQTDARGITVNYRYDALNRLTDISYPDESQNVRYIYDEDDAEQPGIGRLTTLIDASGRSHYHYDKRGNISAVEHNREQTTYRTVYSYNLNDQITQIIYPDGRLVNQSYDINGQLSDITTASSDNPDAWQTLLSHRHYQPFGPVRSQTFGNGLISQQSHDLDYRIHSQITHSTLERSYAFDANNNIIRIDDLLKAQNDQHYLYDPLDRLIQTSNSAEAIDYRYDATGNRLSKKDNIGRQTIRYDNDNNQISRLQTKITQDYHYDANGNLIDNGVYQFQYSDDNRLHRVTQNGQLIASYRYNAHGQRSSKTVNGETIHYIYNLNGQLSTEINQGQAHQLALLHQQAQQQHDITHHQQQLEQTIANINSQQNTLKFLAQTITQAQTEKTRLTKHLHRLTRRYSVYQRIISILIDWQHRIPDYLANRFQRLLSRYQHRTQRLHTLLTTTQQQHAEQQVVIDNTQLQTNQAQTQFQQLQQQQQALQQQLSHQQTQLLRTQQRIAALENNGTNIHPKNYLYANGQLLSIIERDTIYYSHNDHLGTPQALTNQQQRIVWQAHYNPFGYATITTESIVNNVRFPGQYYDSETGLHYNYYRYYDPSIGRYITSDPIGLNGGLNTYAYVGGNPVKFIDPLGLDFGFSVDPALAGGNGHTTLYFQNGSDWYSFNQGGTGNQSLGDAGLVSGSNTQGGVSISPISSPPSSALIFPSNNTEDTAISSCAISSQNNHNSGNSSYNLYSNNCTDASVDVLACAKIRVYNPTFTIKPNSWIDELSNHQPTRCRVTSRGIRCR